MAMRRRAFIAGLGGAAVWPLVARAQRPAMPVVGYITDGLRVSNSSAIEAFRDGLKETGFVEGQNLIIEWRWAEGDEDRLRDYAAELAHLPLAAIWASGNIAAQAAKVATTSIPIVFSTGDDPVATGLVANLNRPGGNLTGVSYAAGVLPPKRLELLHELLPNVTTIGHLINPNNRNSNFDAAAVQAAATELRLRVIVVKAASDTDLAPAFETLVQQRVGTLLINNDIFLFTARKRLVELAASHSIPAINPNRGFPEAGGLMSYGSYSPASVKQVGVYVGRIIKGAKPADLPVVQPTKFELVINLKTARTLGLEIPPSLLARADEVIE
jgi:putative tryptophan/tyrosine transport system substrate-binding protein